LKQAQLGVFPPRPNTHTGSRKLPPIPVVLLETALIVAWTILLRCGVGQPARLASYKSVKPSLVLILWSNIVHNWDIRRPHSPSHLPELNFVRQGTAMAKIEYQYFDANSGIGQTDLANDAFGSLDYGNSHGLRYSSPWPWIFAISISLAMWASLGWIIWVFVR
jgi:hypothetical protein